jgi:hypothetical protein
LFTRLSNEQLCWRKSNEYYKCHVLISSTIFSSILVLRVWAFWYSRYRTISKFDLHQLIGVLKAKPSMMPALMTCRNWFILAHILVHVISLIIVDDFYAGWFFPSSESRTLIIFCCKGLWDINKCSTHLNTLR